MEGKIINSFSLSLRIERVVQIPANLILNFSSKKINGAIQKELYFKGVEYSYLLLKLHLYDIYRTLLHGESLSNSQDELYLDVLNEISRKVLLKSVISCRSIGEKYYDMPQNFQMIEAYYREFNMASKNIQLPKKDDDSYRNIIQEVLSQGYITNKEAEYLRFRLTAIVSGVHIVWQILQKMFQEYRELGILSAISTNQQPQQIESTNTYFNVDLAYIEKIYNFLVNETFPGSISKAIFTSCVTAADFSAIWEITGVKKAKLRYTICALSGKMQNDWYKLAAQSIGSTPQKCSGANVESDWKKSIKGIR